MYRFNHNRQYTLNDFDQPMGLNMDPNNRWVKKVATTIPWDEIETRCADLFLSNTAMPAKPIRTALGSLLIQNNLVSLTGSLWNKSPRNHIFSTSSAFRDIKLSIRLPHL